MAGTFREKVTSDIRERLSLSRRIQYGLFAGGIVLGASFGAAVEPGVKPAVINMASFVALGAVVGAERKRAFATCNNFLSEYDRGASNKAANTFVPKRVEFNRNLMTQIIPGWGVVTGSLGQVTIEQAAKIGPAAAFEDPIYTGIGATLVLAGGAAVGYTHASAKSTEAAFTAHLGAIDRPQ